MGRKIILVLLVAALCMTMLVLPAAAVSQDDLDITLVTDKTAYDGEDSIVTMLTVVNNGSEPVTDIAISSLIPAGYRPAGGYETEKRIAVLGAGETLKVSVIYIPDETSDTSPQTGDTGLFAGLLILVAAIVPVILLWRGEHRKRAISLVLCFAMVAGIPAMALAEPKSVELTAAIAVDGVPRDIRTVVTYTPGEPSEDETVPNETTEPEETESTTEPTEPAEPEVTEPTDPEATDPTEPEATDPTEPEATEPAEPEATEPTEPETTEPTEPETTDPAEPEATEPTEPEATEPTEPEVTEPTEPEVTEPTEPEATEPTEPEVTEPTEPEVTEPTEPEETEPADTDGDGLEDGIEAFLGTDPQKADTDADGLSDSLETNRMGTDPLLSDSDGNGVFDGDEDTDGDGLANLQEISCGTDPAKPDTDSDQLTDGEEAVRYGTDPLVYDSDGDGVYDGYEILLGTNPLTLQEVFAVSEAAGEESDGVQALVNVHLSGEQVSSLHVEPVDDKLLLPETMPGYLGAAYNFTVDGTFESADISFTFDTAALPENADPAIFYYNEQTQMLEKLETVVTDGVATASVSHFSTYVLLDQNSYYGAFTWEDTWVSTGAYSTVEVVLVIDDSGSMGYAGDNNDPNNERLTVAQNMIDRLPDGCKIGVVWFATKTKLLTTELTTDKAAAKALLTEDHFTSIGSYTYMYTAINEAMTLFQSTDANALRTCIVLTDGRAHDYAALHDSTVAAAQEAGVVLHTVGLGGEAASIAEYLQPLAEDTGGQYYLADKANELAAIYAKIGQLIDLSADTDGDTIPNYYEDNAVSFSGVRIALDKTKADTDGDGLADNEEVQIDLVYSEDGSKVYIKGTLQSAPNLVDTDFDGTTDDADPAPGDGSFTGALHTSYADSTVAGKMDYRWFFDDNTVYNKELSRLSVLLSTLIYSGHTLMLTNKAGYVTMKLPAAKVLEYFGMENTKTVSLSEFYSDIHLSEVGLGYRTLEVDGVQKTVLSVTVRGTNGTIEEWSSNCNIGDISTDTAEDDWINTLNHRGFDITANRIMRVVDAYVQENGLDSSELVYWVTGHSRGAAIANIIGANLERDGKTAFTYTFAAPNCTLADDTASYRTIFNVINEDDFVPCLPMEYWGYTTYGRSTTTASIKESYEKVWESFTGIGDYNPDTIGMDNCVAKIGYILPEGSDPRVESYRYTCACHGDGSNDTITIKNGGTSEDSREKAIAKIPQSALEYCIITRYDGGWVGGWDFECCQLPAYLMQLLAAFLGGEIDAYRFAVELNIAKRYEDAKGAIVSAGLGGIEHPHYTESYYVLVDNITAGDFS